MKQIPAEMCGGPRDGYRVIVNKTRIEFDYCPASELMRIVEKDEKTQPIKYYRGFYHLRLGTGGQPVYFNGAFMYDWEGYEI